MRYEGQDWPHRSSSTIQNFGENPFSRIVVESGPERQPSAECVFWIMLRPQGARSRPVSAGGSFNEPKLFGILRLHGFRLRPSSNCFLRTREIVGLKRCNAQIEMRRRSRPQIAHHPRLSLAVTQIFAVCQDHALAQPKGGSRALYDLSNLARIIYVGRKL